MQKNILQAEALCADAISSAVRSLLPIKNILNEYLSDDVLSAEPIIEKGDELKPVGGAFEEPKAVEEPKPVSDIAQPVSIPVPVSVPASIPAPAPAPASIPAPAPAPVPAPVSVEEPKKDSPEEVVIDTEQAVHFSNYDNVFDENSDQVASYKYVPKDDSEPRLEIREESAQPLAADLSVTNLEAPGASSEPAVESGLTVDEILD